MADATLSKDEILRDVNIELEVLRFQIRQAVDLKALPQNGQLALIEKLVAVGQQVGGWRQGLFRQPEGW